jgi:phosphatidylserine/phosphatidylglycerophosphate/cardiolipin synthase-like enzyme
VPIWIDHRARIAHAKTMGIDSAVTLTSSHNWTAAAANFEDLNLVASPAVAQAYVSSLPILHWAVPQPAFLR